MKKSKFLKSSKDLLSRSFNPSKCKISLRLAGSRLKLLKNKKEVQVKQMKREIAQLLESGKDQTARIRVEHVIREEKMMAAYDLMEIYCELLVARLPIIESQKICPTDLKEAVTSVIFASPRCGDVPELLDVRKQFTEKYGKDFTTAAIEFRPECGVSRLLVEKLSAVAPDGPSKIKILSAIAEEHNVKWDAKSFEEKHLVLPSDLLTEPITFGPPVSKSPDVQVPHSNNKMHGSPLNFTQMEDRTSLGTEIYGVNTASQHEARSRGDERAQLFQGDSTTSTLDRRRWNMEFKDATSAAQAAAESAELASMAARAAAQLSSRGRITRENSTEPHKSEDVHVLNDRGHETYTNPKLTSEQFFEESINRSFSERTRLHNEQIDRRFEDDRGERKEYSQSASLKYKASIDDDSLDKGVPVVDGYSQKNSMKDVSRGEMSMQRQSFKYKAENANDWPKKYENVREERIRNQPSDKYSHSYSSISYGENTLSEDRKFENDAGEDTFLGKASIYGEVSWTSSHDATVVFDNYDSDNGTHGFDMSPTYDDQEPGFHLPLSQTDSWSPRSGSSKIVKSPTSSLFPTRKKSFSENSRHMDGSKLAESVPWTFDESDEPASESDEDMNMSMHTRISRDLLSKQNPSVGSQFKDKIGQSSLNRKLSDDKLNFKETDRETKQGKNIDIDPPSPSELSVGKPSADQQAMEPQMELNYIRNSSSKNEEGLNIEKLTGGFHHKGYNHHPYLNNRFDVSSSSFIKETEETTSTFTRPNAVESPKISTTFEHKKSTRTPDIPSELNSDSSEEEESLRKRSNKKQDRYTLSYGEEVKTKPSLASSNSIFGSDDSDLDEDLQKESLHKTSNVQSGISRRTKASGNNVYYKTQLDSEALDFDDNINRKPTTFKISETPKKHELQRNSSNFNKYKHPTSAKMPTQSSLWGTPDQHDPGKSNSVRIQESKNTRKSSSTQESSRSQTKIGSSVNSENVKAATLSKTSSNKDDSTKKASHVHPKLPDYDTLVQLLRKNRS